MALQESGGCFLYCCCFLLSPNAYGGCQPAPCNILVLQSSPRFVGFVSWLGNNKTGHLQFYQSSSDIPVVGKSTDEKLILEQAGSGYATFPFFLCFCVLGVNASESKKCFDKKRGKITWKACPLPHAQGRYLPSISIFLPCIVKSGKEPRPYWNLILFWNYVQFGIFLRWESLACSSFPLTVLRRVGDLGWISVFCAYKAAGASMAGLECVVSTHWMWKKTPFSFIQTVVFVCTQSVWFHWSPKVMPVWDTNQVYVFSRQRYHQKKFLLFHPPFSPP